MHYSTEEYGYKGIGYKGIRWGVENVNKIVDKIPPIFYIVNIFFFNFVETKNIYYMGKYISKTDWRAKAIQRSKDNKAIRKSKKEVEESRDKWKLKFKELKAINLLLIKELEIIKKKIEKIL
jgi:hypothetical protein